MIGAEFLNKANIWTKRRDYRRRLQHLNGDVDDGRPIAEAVKLIDRNPFDVRPLATGSEKETVVCPAAMVI